MKNSHTQIHHRRPPFTRQQTESRYKRYLYQRHLVPQCTKLEADHCTEFPANLQKAFIRTSAALTQCQVFCQLNKEGNLPSPVKFAGYLRIAVLITC
mmetsp:Transcript_22268/g.41455  ORF Transcript_22268/g.41455 Transcript_22268/m.41455 type:complete len:97 (+) Transcript_22268:731-1021(+)